MIPGMGGSVEVEHLHRYALACLLVRDKVVLDVACGEGYGIAMLAEHPKVVTGIDIFCRRVPFSLHARRCAQARIPGPNHRTSLEELVIG
jgi:hypothetical protein